MTTGKRPWLMKGGGIVLCATLFVLPAVFSQDGTSPARARLLEMRANKPKEYAELYQDAKAFLALPPAKQKAIRALHKDLQKLSPLERERLTQVMKRYVDWLDHLPESERKSIDQADKQTRLKVISEVREKEWLARQPKVVREYIKLWPKIPPAQAVASTLGLLATPRYLRPMLAVSVFEAETIDPRPEMIKRLKQDEAYKAREWLITSRFWDELTQPKKGANLPTHAVDCSPAVDLYVKEYLRPMLSKDERDRLDKAEGQWPLYPMTLVEIADKHPIALPPRLGPTKFEQLPAEVRKSLSSIFVVKGFGFDKSKKFALSPDFMIFESPQFKTLRKKVQDRLEDLKLENAGATRFITILCTLAHDTEKISNFRVGCEELWPTKYTELSAKMREFMDEKGSFYMRLSHDEKKDLKDAHYKWPEYPLKIRELAARYGERPPWMTLPEADKHQWHKYRLGHAAK
jgi:hypothetical protein